LERLLYFEIYKRCLSCRERGSLQTCYPLWSIVRLLYYNLTALHRDSSYPPPGNVLSSSVGLSPGNLHQSWNLNSSYMIISCLINILYFLWKLNIFWSIIIYKVFLWNHWAKLNLHGKKGWRGPYVTRVSNMSDRPVLYQK